MKEQVITIGAYYQLEGTRQVLEMEPYMAREEGWENYEPRNYETHVRFGYVFDRGVKPGFRRGYVPDLLIRMLVEEDFLVKQSEEQIVEECYGTGEDYHHFPQGIDL